MAEINGIQVPFVPIVERDNFPGSNKINTGNKFNDIFTEELEKVKFSGHAMKRLESRNIKFSDTELTKLNTAIEKAENKGAKDSVVLMEDTALIVNIPNKTVVTAMQVGNGGEDVFTNIDSVVFA